MRLRFALLGCSLAASAHAQTLDVGTNDAIRIEVAHVDALVEEGVARVDVDETFRNTTARALEGVYRFKLPEDAVVGSFSMWMNGHEKRGRVLDAKEARATYDAIVRKQRDPGLLEQIGWREFRVNVFPIPAADTVRIKLVYAHPLRSDLGFETLEVALPTQGAVGDLRVHVKLRTRHGLTALDSPSHPKAVLTLADGEADASLGGDGVVPSGPFVLRAFARREGYDVTLLSDRPEGSADGWFVLRVVPKFAAPMPIPRDVVFVVDRSGSMADRKIEQARAALIAGLATLRTGDRFDVVSFATDVTSLGETGLLDVSDANRARALRAADELVATGGTNIEGALAAALKRASGDPKRLFAIVFLTDGDPTVGVTDPDRILASWRATAGAARLFAFGVGSDVKDFLLTKLAVEGRGDARYVRENENLEVPLAALFDRVRTPLLLDPEIDFGGDGIVVTEREPRRLPDLFQGRALLVAGRYHGSGHAQVHLHGRSGEQTVQVDVPIDLPSVTPGRPHVAQIWAKQRVERLLDDMRILGANGELRDEVRRLGLAHQLVTPYTSFLVVEDAAKLAQDDRGILDRNAVPVDRSDADSPPTLDEGSRFDGTPDLPSGMAGGTSIGVSGGRGGGSQGHLGAGVSAFAGRRAGAGGAGGNGLKLLGGQSSASTQAAGPLFWLAKHQSKDGSFDLELFTAECSQSPCSGRGEANHAIAATGLVVLASLASGNEPDRGPFRRIARDGLRYLVSKCDDDGCIGSRDAPDFLRQHAIAALALTEMNGISPMAAIGGRARDAVAFALRSRDSDGVWKTSDGSLDLETTAWMVLLLRSAIMEKYEVDADALDRIVHALDAAFDPASGKVRSTKLTAVTATAVDLLARRVAGHVAADDPRIAKDVEILGRELPEQARSAADADPRFFFFAGLALHYAGSAPSDDWNQAMRTLFIESSEPNRPDDDSAFSWNPSGPDAATLGRLGTTALDALTLSIYFRYPLTVGVRTK